MRVFSLTLAVLLGVTSAECSTREAVFAHYWSAVAEGPAPRLVFTVDKSVSRSGRDAYAVRGGKGALTFTGANERSLWYALYDFFAREGCAWFWDGDRLPARHAVDLGKVDFRSEADKEVRGLRYFAHRSLRRFQAEQWDWDDWSRELEWMLKARINFFMLRLGTVDLFQRAFPDIVKYPEGFECPEAFGYYNYRHHLWKLEAQSALRAKVLGRAHELGLMTAEDTGTPTHWYSRTPLAYLDAVRPKLMAQSNASYNQRTGLVWDIRERENLDAYFKLTEASIAAYGGGRTPDFFHTIGLGERNYFTDRAKNHALKLEVYDLTQKRIRESYPDVPLLIGTWDFINSWSPAEVRALVRTLDPQRTVIFDYTSDIFDEYNNFQTWGLVGRFPWYYGIFHAYEASNEIRGNYHDNIHDRFPIAAADPMCKGVIYWPECSHSDTLMIDYFPAIGWDTSAYDIDARLPDFCRRRYGEKGAERMLAVWRRVLPAAEESRWGTQVGDDHRVRPQREIYPDCYFALRGFILGDDQPCMYKRWEYFTAIDQRLGPRVKAAAEALDALAALPEDSLDPLTTRDRLDLSRTVAGRALEVAFARMGLAVDAWQRGGDPQPLRAAIDRVKRLGGLLADLLEAGDEFSLAAAARDVALHESNPDAADVLKRNAFEDYCHSYIYELARYLYRPAFDELAAWMLRRIDAGDRSSWCGTAAEQDEAINRAGKAFLAKPLGEMAPNVSAAKARLGATLKALADELR